MPKRHKCTSSGKILYPTEQDAMDVLKHARKRFHKREGMIPTRYYECDACGGYHLSSKSTGLRTGLTMAEDFKKYLQ